MEDGGKQGPVSLFGTLELAEHVCNIEKQGLHKQQD
jgi:hypothetical protein